MNSAEHKAKVAVLRFLIKQGSLARDAVILNEYSANFSGIRADFALLQSDGLHGIEIKSEADSLTRLERQLAGYRRCFSSVTVALAENHLSNARKKLPSFAGILVIEQCRVSIIRPPKVFRRKKLDVVRALPQKELEKFLRQNGIQPANMNRSKLESIALRFSTEDISQLSAAYLRRTYGQYSNDLLNCNVDEINYGHVQRLSRFKAKRDRIDMLVSKRRAMFNSWQDIGANQLNPITVNLPNHHRHLFVPA